MYMFYINNLLIFLRHNYHWIMIVTLIILAIYLINKKKNEREIEMKQIKEIEKEKISKNKIIRNDLQCLKNQYHRKIQNKKVLINQKQHNITHLINTIDPSLLIENYLSLKDLYYNGIPDKYDLNGLKIKGIPPDPELSIYYLNLAIQEGYLRGWIELGQMYHYGFYNFPSDLDRAEQIYQYIIKNISDQSILNEVNDLYWEANEENQKIKTHQWLNLQYTTTIQPKKTLYEINQSKRPQIINFNYTQNEPIDLIDINHLFRTGHNINTNIDEPDNNRRIKNDMHNVHDHSVIATIKQSIERLQKDTKIEKDKNLCMYEIRTYLCSLVENDKKKDAIRALDSIEKNYMPLSFTELKETDALALVWNRIHSDKHSDLIQTLKENLADELAECIEHDKPVCATGRFTRILDTLNVIDDAVNVKPTYAINEEMMTKAGKIRDDKFNQLTEDQKKIVNDIAPTEFQKKWFNELKEEIKKQLADDYVKSNILTENTFETEIKQWIDEI